MNNETKKFWKTMLTTAAVVAAAVIVGFYCSGCATKTRNVEIDGMFVQAESQTVAIGSVDVMAAPVGEESAIVKYDEDTAWLSPSTKTHSIKIQLTGTNCTEKVDSIIEHICKAFIPTAAIVNGVTISPNTNSVNAASSIVTSAVQK